MSIRYRVHQNSLVVHTVIDHTADQSELPMYREQITGVMDSGRRFNHVIELLPVDPRSHGIAVNLALLCLVPPIQRMPIAIVAPGDMEFDIARNFQLKYGLPRRRFAVFRTLREALDWLGVTYVQVEWGNWRIVQRDSEG